MDRNEILYWLRENDPAKLKTLWERADALRRERVGDEVHLRGLIEMSNICRRNCAYCGVRAGRTGITRYRLSDEEIYETGALAAEFGYGTIVIQSGEDLSASKERIAGIIRELKKRFGLAITLSLGERPEEDWREWKEAGADRYLIRFETTNKRLYEIIHPRLPHQKQSEVYDRLKSLETLRRIGYEIGSGVMIGIPGQSMEDLANDIEMFRALDLDMIGTGPFLAHPETPLGRFANALAESGTNDPSRWEEIGRQTGLVIPFPEEQVESSNLMAFKVIALTRLVRPDANIPSTTAIATNDGKFGRITGLSRGANVVMPNLTPKKYRALYEIYPHKAATLESARQTHETALAQIREIGRVPGTGPGGRAH